MGSTKPKVELRSITGHPYNRAGVRWETQWTEVDLSKFDEKQLDILKNDPHLEARIDGRRQRASGAEAALEANEDAAGRLKDLAARAAGLEARNRELEARTEELARKVEDLTLALAAKQAETLATPTAPAQTTLVPETKDTKKKG